MRRLLVIALPAFLTDMGFYLALFALSHVLERQGASAIQVGFVFGIYNLAYVVLAPLLGRWSDRHRLPALLLGAGIYALSYSLLGGLFVFQGSGETATVALRGGGSLAAACYAGMGVLALSNALFWPAFQARLADRESDPAALEAALRLFNLAWTSGKALGFLAGGFLFAYAPGACLWVVAGVGWVVVGCALLDARWTPEPALDPAAGVPDSATPVPGASGAKSRRTRVPQGRKRAFLLAALLTNLALWAAVSTLKGLAPTLAHAWGIGVAQTGVLLAATLGAQGLGFFLLQSGRWPYRPGLLLLAAPVACLGLLGLTAARGLGLALVAALAIGWAQAVTYASSVYYSLDYDERRGLRTGIHEAMLAAGGTVPILGGYLSDRSGDELAPLWLAIALGACAALLAAGLLWRAPAAPPGDESLAG